MVRKLFVKCSLFFLIMSLAACGGLRFSQVTPEAKDFHPKTIAIFPVEIVGSNEEARGSVEQIVAGVLAEKKWFSDILDTESLNRQLLANEELRKAMTDYLSKLRTVNFSDPDLSKKIGGMINAEAFLLVSVDTWNYTVEKGDKVGKVSLGMKLHEASTGKIMWKAGHQIADSYILIKPDLPKIARNVVNEMVNYMPH
ncbi:MAG: hypothetical protein CVU54_15030 [Deltaproteobacteria bacterium HGW-Deltaproteobacteria-12]|nr:MAG: hypothetical protein CVU54_15030 [Deltaproteobacteria bacterium HGW-Deltaproteobacteria-12]